jgi:hypothetical protein
MRSATFLNKSERQNIQASVRTNGVTRRPGTIVRILRWIVETLPST